MIKKLQHGWIRDTSQEDNVVFRWYERKDAIASLVEGPFDNEAEWRISSPNSDSISSRGYKEIMLKKSDAENIRKIETLIRREKMK